MPALRVARLPRAALSCGPCGPARARGNVFIEAEVDAPAPYVQQSVGYTLRLYYATQLISGQLDLPPPEGASLQRVGSDVQYNRDIGGRRYTVVERRYLLLPERSGALVLPGARFEGRGVGNLFDDIFSDGQRALSARGPDITLDVRAMPATAPRPWLPLRALSMRWVDPPRTARVGDATTVELEIVADGAMSAQLAAPTVDADQGAQVFAEPAQVDETVRDGRPQLRLLRRFSVLPARDGRMRVVARHRWWDVDPAVASSAARPNARRARAGRGPPCDGAAVPPLRRRRRRPLGSASRVQGEVEPGPRPGRVRDAVAGHAGWALQQRQRARGVRRARRRACGKPGNRRPPRRAPCPGLDTAPRTGHIPVRARHAAGRGPRRTCRPHRTRSATRRHRAASAGALGRRRCRKCTRGGASRIRRRRALADGIDAGRCRLAAAVSLVIRACRARFVKLGRSSHSGTTA